MTYKQQMQENGYVLIEGFFNKEKIKNIQKILKLVYDNILIDKNISCGNTLHESMINLYKYDLSSYKKVSASLWRIYDLFELVQNKDVIDFLRNELNYENIFLSGAQIFHIMSNYLKIPDGYFGLGAHQDFDSLQGSLDGVVVWVPLVDIDENLFPVEIIPGSHKKGPLPQLKLTTGAGWQVQPEYFNEADFIPVKCKMGDIVFMNTFTIHKSSQKGDDRLRLAFSSRYENGIEPTFIKRCYPTGYTRGVHREQLHDVSIYFK